MFRPSPPESPLTFGPFSPPARSPAPSSADRFMATTASSATLQGFGPHRCSPWWNARRCYGATLLVGSSLGKTLSFHHSANSCTCSLYVQSFGLRGLGASRPGHTPLRVSLFAWSVISVTPSFRSFIGCSSGTEIVVIPAFFHSPTSHFLQAPLASLHIPSWSGYDRSRTG